MLARLPCSGGFDADLDAPADNTDREDAHGLGHWGAFRRAGLEVEQSLVQRAFDAAVFHEAVREACCAVGAEVVECVKVVAVPEHRDRDASDREARGATVLEAAFRANVVPVPGNAPPPFTSESPRALEPRPEEH